MLSKVFDAPEVFTPSEIRERPMISTTTSLNHLCEKVRDVLALDPEEFALDFREGELVGFYMGLSLRSEFLELRDLRWNRILGYEAHLLISKGENPIEPEAAFQFAGESGRLVCLDRIIRALHALSFRQLSPDGGLLFLKVHPQLLFSVTKHGLVFEKILHAYSIPTHQVVIELRMMDVGLESLYEALMNYKSRGYRISIADFQGYGVELLSRVAPDYVRLKRPPAWEDGRGKELRGSFQELVKMIHHLGGSSIVEGIESHAQLQVVLDSGAFLGQGPLFGGARPMRQRGHGTLLDAGN